MAFAKLKKIYREDLGKANITRKYEIINDVNKAILVSIDGTEIIADDFTRTDIIKTHEWFGQIIHILYPIRALRDFGNVRKGDIGGYIESEHNLAHEGNCWICKNTWVFGEAIVCESAIIDGGIIYGDALVHGNARVVGNVNIFDRSYIAGDAYIHALSGFINIYGNARVFGHAEINADEIGDGISINDSCIRGKSYMCSYGHPFKVSGAFILSDTYICSKNDFATMKGIGVCYREEPSYPAVFYKNINGDIAVNYEGFIGTLKEFRRRVIKKCSQESQKMLKEHLMALEMAKLHFE